MASDDPIPRLTAELAAARAGRELLRAAIHRAAEVLALVDYAQLSFDLGKLGGSTAEPEGVDATWRAGQALNAMVDARRILAEADPGEPGGEGVGDG